MKASQLRNLSEDELDLKLASLKKELFDLRMQAAGGKLDKPHRLRLVRTDVARVLTLRRDRSVTKK